MAPELVLKQLRGGERGYRVLDPMMGSGTTIVTARHHGYEAYGIDRDPLAVLIASAWAADLDIATFRAEGEELLETARHIARQLPQSEWYPPKADEETRTFVRYWFDGESRRQLSALVRALGTGRYRTKLHLYVALSRMIITKQRGVSLAWDVSHSRPHRKVDLAPVAPFDFLLQNIEAISSRALFTDSASLPRAQVRPGDCRNLSRFPDDYFHYVITSPPYLNAIDYLRGHKLTLVWFEQSVAQIARLRHSNIGAEVGLADTRWDDVVSSMVRDPEEIPRRLLNLCRRYASDLDKAMGEISRVARVGAKVVLVVGDCTIRGHRVYNSGAIKFLARRHGLERLRVQRRALQTKRRYLPPPSSMEQNELSQRMAEEVIISGFAA
jgi:adenine-specific DNA methylase